MGRRDRAAFAHSGRDRLRAAKCGLQPIPPALISNYYSVVRRADFLLHFVLVFLCCSSVNCGVKIAIIWTPRISCMFSIFFSITFQRRMNTFGCLYSRLYISCTKRKCMFLFVSKLAEFELNLVFYSLRPLFQAKKVTKVTTDLSDSLSDIWEYFKTQIRAIVNCVVLWSIYRNNII